MSDPDMKKHDAEKPKGDQPHWLVRPDTIRKLWILLSIILALTVAVQMIFPIKGKFGVDGWFGFPAVYGFLTCIAMVIGAKVLGFALKRKDDYYDD